MILLVSIKSCGAFLRPSPLHTSQLSRWAYFWQLPFTARGKAGEPLTLGDTMHVFRTNIEQVEVNQMQQKEAESWTCISLEHMSSSLKFFWTTK